MTIDRNPEGRDTGMGFIAKVESKTVEELLHVLIVEIRALHFALMTGRVAEDTGHFDNMRQADLEY